MSPAPTPELIRSEALALRAQVVRKSRRVADSMRPVRLDETEPALVRAFWESLGWTPLLAELLGEPERESGRKRAERYMAEWRSWGEGFALELKDLPRHFRLAEPDPNQGVGFSITNEDGGEADPPVLFISADEGTVRPSLPGYLRLAGHRVLTFALDGWYRTRVETQPPLTALAGVSRPYPHLVPAALRLSEEVWALPLNALDEAPEPTLSHARFEALLDWLASARDLEALHVPHLPGRVWPLSVSLEHVDAALPDLRKLRGLEQGMDYRVGMLEGVGILLAASPSGSVRLSANARHAGHLEQVLGARGWLSSR
ncbi:hypothetical protein CYFUS_008080 [Cystobacter fuscus]|uniref:Uncharacterized protein n=1 Tax=Cystobacter fuscus TaxID=43 RepID=A0A250JGS0_9BACT|nr:hypothetical protein [Cystobacter fuscus]ATB42601.1 hypothetical protein CYFUS_008080 [Cystobacter fuscus]